VSDGDRAFDEWFVGECVAKGLSAGSHHGRVDYRLNNKIVVNIEDDGSVTLKLPLDEQQALLSERPDEVSLPAGWAKHGWTTIRLDRLDRAMVVELLVMSIETVSAGSPSKPKKTR
jgi:hypothetical protein